MYSRRSVSRTTHSRIHRSDDSTTSRLRFKCVSVWVCGRHTILYHQLSPPFFVLSRSLFSNSFSPFCTDFQHYTSSCGKYPSMSFVRMTAPFLHHITTDTIATAVPMFFFFMLELAALPLSTLATSSPTVCRCPRYIPKFYPIRFPLHEISLLVNTNVSVFDAT